MKFQWCPGGLPTKKKKMLNLEQLEPDKMMEEYNDKEAEDEKKEKKKSDYTKAYKSIPKKRTRSDCAEEEQDEKKRIKNLTADNSKRLKEAGIDTRNVSNQQVKDLLNQHQQGELSWERYNTKKPGEWCKELDVNAEPTYAFIYIEDDNNDEDNGKHKNKKKKDKEQEQGQEEG
ncbi:hypothetical protein RFI_30926 [Reticulomyxa filosa]|uniref:Uncharacterized protein n=1 Tax=Reticulomyxa filosa TaxID=46433 RepID=X6LX08_RETFI|nr:hypothetical protein RFI_30926 [Reticulomyxa filosa]|eukprot:ETO06463.1 hypothetical protein RFI_30926 [Reticulomyxa filosa]